MSTRAGSGSRVVACLVVGSRQEQEQDETVGAEHEFWES